MDEGSPHMPRAVLVAFFGIVLFLGAGEVRTNAMYDAWSPGVAQTMALTWVVMFAAGLVTVTAPGALLVSRFRQ